MQERAERSTSGGEWSVFQAVGYSEWFRFVVWTVVRTYACFSTLMNHATVIIYT